MKEKILQYLNQRITEGIIITELRLCNETRIKVVSAIIALELTREFIENLKDEAIKDEEQDNRAY